MKKSRLGKRLLACAVSAVTLLTGTSALSGMTTLSGMNASAASYDNYAKLLQYSMYFYDANMCGDQVSETGLMDWRDDCHTSDQVTGGFHDAGDHVKFGLPAGYSAAMLGWGYYEYKDVYDSLGQTQHLQTLTDYFAQYFKDCTTLSGGSVSSFIYQIGNGDQDHAVWCAPEVQDASSRQVYTTTNSASDIAAGYAAALAVNYINFGNAEDLTYAKALYEFSTKYNSVADEGTSGFYGSSDYYDEQAWAAGWLYLATNDSSYKTFLNTFMNASNQGKSGQAGCKWGVYTTMCWDNVSLGAAILQAEITGASSDWSKVSTYIGGKCTSESTYYCETEWGSCRANAALQMCALIASKHSSSMDYTSWCKAQMGMILGNNPINTNFVVGFDSNSAKYPHHRAASGYDSGAEMTGQTGYASDGHTLVGALVGGPADSNWTYTDTIQDYKCNEVALDYNAGLVGAAAGLYEVYGTGSLDSSIEGTKSGGVSTTPIVTTKQDETTTKATTTEKTTTTQGGGSSSSGESNINYTTGTETGESGAEQLYAEFAPGDAKTITVTYNVSSSDSESVGAFGTWNGEWVQEDFTVSVGSGGLCTATYTVPDDVGATVKFSVYWPTADSVSIVSIVGDSGSSSGGEQTTVTTKATTKATTTTTASQGGSSDDVELTPTQATEMGDDGYYNYVEFSPNGAKSATAYFTVTSNDTEASGSFGTWNGEWLQEDFKVSVPSGGSCTADYTIPSNVGSTVKFSIYWPGVDGCKIDKIVLHYGDVTTPGTTENGGGSSSSSGGAYTLQLDQYVDYDALPAGDKMLGWEWAQFGIPDDETITKVEVNLTAKGKELGKWQGAFGSSTSVDPDYWTQTEDMEQTVNAKSGSITWDIDAATAAIIQRNYGGELKFGVWWIDCTYFTIDSITVYTDAYSGGSSSGGEVTTTTTKLTTTTTSSKATTTTAKTTTTKAATTTQNQGGSTVAASIYGDVNLDGKVDISDAVLLNKYAANAVKFNDAQYANADTCTDDGVGSSDAVVLLKFLVGIVKTLPSANQ